MQASTAVALIFAGLSLWAQRRDRHLRFGQFAAFGALAIALGTAFEHFTGVHLGLDGPATSTALASGSLYPGRMPFQTATLLTFVSLVLVLIHQKQGRPLRLVLPGSPA